MSNLESFKIDLKSLSEGETIVSLVEDDGYFAALEGNEIKRGQLQTTVTINRTGDIFSLDFHTSGVVIIPCDLCLDDMEQPIDADSHLVAKFGENYSEDDELVTVPENEGILDVAWLVYQLIALSVPLRHVHAPGKCNPAMMKVLNEYSAARSGDGNDEPTVDSRWEALRNIKLND
jgi:uncharacterized metal-binding protein YceD (DUF177 family)